MPDSDCIVNKGDHSPRGGTNALTVYTTRKHPLTKPTERHLHPMVRDAKGGPLRQVSWDEALDRVADAIKRALDTRGPSSIGLWGADHLSPEMNFSSTQAVLRRDARRAFTTRRSAPTWASRCARSTTARSGTPSTRSSPTTSARRSTLLYSYRDFEIADTVLISGANSYETGTVLYNRMHAQEVKKVVIDPRKTVPAKNAEDLGGVHLQLKPNTDVVLLNSLMNVILREDRHDQAFIDARCDAASFETLRDTVLPGQVPARERGGGRPAFRPPRSAGRRGCWASRRRPRSCSRRASSGRAPRTTR